MSDASMRQTRWLRLTLVPAVVFVLLAILFLVGLNSRDPSVVP